MSSFFKKNVIVFVYAVLILSTLLVFWQVYNFDFVNYDDGYYVYENPHVSNGLTGDSIIWAFTTTHKGYWQPLTWLSLIINRQLFGPGPGGFHLINVFLHLANTLLLFAVLRKMTGSLWQSAFVATAFALHPMHVESVAWIAERKDVLSTLFLLLTLTAYVYYVRNTSYPYNRNSTKPKYTTKTNNRNSTKPRYNTPLRYLLTLLLFFLGLLAKPMLITLPFLLLLLDYWPLRRFDPDQARKGLSRKKRKSSPAYDKRKILLRVIIEKIPFFIIAAVSGVVTFLTQRAGGVIVGIDKIPLNERIINAVFSYAAYIGKLFWPFNLAVNYPFNSSTVASITPVQLVLYALLLGGLSLLAFYFWSSRKYLLVGWLWFLGTLIPVIGLVQFTGSSYADRFTYIPYIGLFIMIGWGLPGFLSKWPYRKFALGISAAVVLATLGIGAYLQTGVWKNSITLFSHATKVTTGNYFAYNNLGTAYEKLGRLQDAAEAYQQAIRIKPDFTEVHFNLGNVYTNLGRYQEAINAYRQAIKIKPDFKDVYYNLGNAYLALNRNQEAVESFNQAIKIKPDFEDAHFNLGTAYLNLGYYKEAIETYQQVLRIGSDSSEEIYCNLGVAFYNLGRYPEAIESLRQAVKIKPDYVDAHANLGFIYLTAGDKDSALEEYKILKTLGAIQADQLYNAIQN